MFGGVGSKGADDFATGFCVILKLGVTEAVLVVSMLEVGVGNRPDFCGTGVVVTGFDKFNASDFDCVVKPNGDVLVDESNEKIDDAASLFDASVFAPNENPVAEIEAVPKALPEFGFVTDLSAVIPNGNCVLSTAELISGTFGVEDVVICGVPKIVPLVFVELPNRDDAVDVIGFTAFASGFAVVVNGFMSGVGSNVLFGGVGGV